MRAEFSPTVYILASSRNGTLYIDVTSDLVKRVFQHRTGAFKGFSAKYTILRLVWFEQHATMEHAIQREKRLKKWNRTWKLRLIEQDNPDWSDLSEELGFESLPRAGFPPSRE